MIELNDDDFADDQLDEHGIPVQDLTPQEIQKIRTLLELLDGEMLNLIRRTLL